MRDEYLLEDYRSVKDQKKYLYLIIYDIIDNKRRNRIFKLLKGYGQLVQKSCCETYLTEKEYATVEQKLCSYIDPEEDNIRVYQLHGLNRVFNYGIDNPHTYTDLLIL